VWREVNLQQHTKVFIVFRHRSCAIDYNRSPHQLYGGPNGPRALLVFHDDGVNVRQLFKKKVSKNK
jgi:hypothetical protein